LPDSFADSLDLLYANATSGDDQLVRLRLGDLVPEYSHAEDQAPAAAMALALASPYADEF
jgi:hypothetical protein